MGGGGTEQDLVLNTPVGFPDEEGISRPPSRPVWNSLLFNEICKTKFSRGGKPSQGSELGECFA